MTQSAQLQTTSQPLGSSQQWRPGQLRGQTWTMQATTHCAQAPMQESKLRTVHTTSQELLPPQQQHIHVTFLGPCLILRVHSLCGSSSHMRHAVAICCLPASLVPHSKPATYSIWDYSYAETGTSTRQLACRYALAAKPGDRSKAEHCVPLELLFLQHNREKLVMQPMYKDAAALRSADNPCH